MVNTLFIRLEGPLQAWGERARWSVRDTTTEPTKSGVVGLLGCALGVVRDDDLIAISRAVHMGVRCDREGTFLTDFHTVVGGVLNAEGKVKHDTMLSWRSYLCDASFLVALQGSTETIQRLGEALKKPHWQVFLGRRSCVPALPLYAGEGDYPDLFSALQQFPYHGSLADGGGGLRVVLEVAAGAGVQRRDETLSNRRRTFLPRYVREQRVIPVLYKEEG